MVRVWLGQLGALAGEWGILRLFVQDESDLDTLRRLHAELEPRLRVPILPTTSARAAWRTASG